MDPNQQNSNTQVPNGQQVPVIQGYYVMPTPVVPGPYYNVGPTDSKLKDFFRKLIRNSEQYSTTTNSSTTTILRSYYTSTILRSSSTCSFSFCILILKSPLHTTTPQINQLLYPNH